MAQLRQNYDEIIQMDGEVLVVGPENTSAFKEYWDSKDLPFIGLPDPDHKVANLFRQEVNLLKLGRMPAMMIIDKAGRIRYSHFGESMRDILSLDQVFSMLDELSKEELETL
jgi:peroxiredoxin